MLSRCIDDPGSELGIVVVDLEHDVLVYIRASNGQAGLEESEALGQGRHGAVAGRVPE